MDGSHSTILDLSKLAKIEDVREKLVPHFKAEPERQRLFFRGKQMEDGHTLFDYEVNVNDIIQVLIRPVASALKETTTNGSLHSEDEISTGSNKENRHFSDSDSDGQHSSTASKDEAGVQQSKYYKLGDQVDVWDSDTGSWYEGKLIKITHTEQPKSRVECDENCNEAKICDTLKSKDNDESVKMFDSSGHPLRAATDGYTYHILFDGYEEPTEYPFGIVRPIAYKKLTLDDISVGDVVLANYYIEDPQKRGYFYDTTISKKDLRSRTCREIEATINVGHREAPLENCKLLFLDEFYRVERPVELTKRSSDLEYWMQVGKPPKREIRPDCEFCKDRKSVKCVRCSCRVCGAKDQPSKQLLCDECNSAYHIWCLDPPMEELPGDDDWYCPDCKNDASEVVRAGEKLKESKKKAKLASNLSSCTRDWGKGMACVGRTKHCTLVPPNHYGPIPGVEVGTLWKFRLQASEVGVHRPHVAGIHGREHEGAYSIVLAGGYEDDLDFGDEFMYTGSGGRDLSGNKRTAQQSSDQTLTRMNKALALNCNATIDSKVGTTSSNWQKGKPVRVLRSSKGKKHSEFSPDEGIRYDGIYKVVKYWPEKGKAGFNVWRYLLRRDDPTHAPWTKAGKTRTKRLGLEMQYPEGYLEALAEKNGIKEVESGSPDRNAKRSLSDNEAIGSPKRTKTTKYKLQPEVDRLILSDEPNKHLWDECLEQLNEGQPKFIAKVEEIFLCVCCQDVVCKPVTTDCNHNVCQVCLTRAFSLKMHNCPACRHTLGKDYPLKVNVTLSDILRTLFPGYENRR